MNMYAIYIMYIVYDYFWVSKYLNGDPHLYWLSIYYSNERQNILQGKHFTTNALLRNSEMIEL